MRALRRAVIASVKLRFKVRPIVTSVRHGSRLLFSDKLLLYTNTGLSVGLSIAGDFMQQNVKSVRDGSGKKWDKKRTSHMAASGFAVGPVAHYWYLYLDKWFPGRNAVSLIKKVALDQLVLSPVYVAIFLVTIGVLEGQRWALMKKEFKGTGVSMIVSDIVVWTPAQTINFYFVPTRFRVLFDSCISFVMDMWYSYLRFDRHPSSSPVILKHCRGRDDCEIVDCTQPSVSCSEDDSEGCFTQVTLGAIDNLKWNVNHSRDDPCFSSKMNGFSIEASSL